VGTRFLFDEKLPADRIADDGTHETIDRQLEIFTHGDRLYLRVGPPPGDTKGESEVTIELTMKRFGRFRNALQAAGRDVRYLAW
jgi:hypothetical protein